MSALKSLQQILPLKNDQPLDELNPTPISTELSLEHYRASLQQSNNENLAKCVSQFESFNHKIKEHKKKLIVVGEIIEEF